jgi:hypothetical protein
MVKASGSVSTTYRIPLSVPPQNQQSPHSQPYCHREPHTRQLVFIQTDTFAPASIRTSVQRGNSMHADFMNARRLGTAAVKSVHEA